MTVFYVFHRRAPVNGHTSGHTSAAPRVSCVWIQCKVQLLEDGLVIEATRLWSNDHARCVYMY